MSLFACAQNHDRHETNEPSLFTPFSGTCAVFNFVKRVCAAVRAVFAVVFRLRDRGLACSPGAKLRDLEPDEARTVSPGFPLVGWPT